MHKLTSNQFRIIEQGYYHDDKQEKLYKTLQISNYVWANR